MTEVSSQTLHVVSKELGTTLNEARVALENFAEHPETTKLLEQCAQQLHQAHGVLRMVEVYGAALLAEEMEQVTRYLVGATSARCPDARDGAAARIPGTGAERRTRPGPRAAAASQRSARGAR
jgi:chemotaxis protein histidine kinase CheA